MILTLGLLQMPEVHVRFMFSNGQGFLVSGMERGFDFTYRVSSNKRLPCKFLTNLSRPRPMLQAQVKH